MSLKRVLNLFLLVTLSLFVLSACSDESENDTTSSRGNGNSIWSELINSGLLNDSGSGSGGGSSSDGLTEDPSTDDDTNTDSDTDTDDDINTEYDTNTDDDTNSDGDTDTDDDTNTDYDTDTDDDTNTDNDTNTDDDTNTEDDTNTDTDDIDYSTINNTYTVEQLDIKYHAAASAGGDTITASSTNGVGSSYYYNENNLALSYDEDTNELTIVGKIEIAWEDMTDMSKVMLNELRYEYFGDIIEISLDELKDIFYKDGDKIKFIYPFTKDGSRITYNASSSDILTFTLTENGEFPADMNKFIEKDRDIIPIHLADDPFSIYGTYSVTGCTAYLNADNVSTGFWVNGTNVFTDYYNLDISNAYIEIFNKGTLLVNFTVDGYYSNTSWITWTELEDYNRTYSFYKYNTDSPVWWGQDTISHNPLNDISTLEITDPKTTDYNQLNVYVKQYRTATPKDYSEFDCRFTKVSDYLN